MARKESACSKCETSLIGNNPMICEEILIPSSGGPVFAAQRTFRGECPKCGTILTTHMGHHATVQEKQMKKWFPRDARAQICSKLLDVEVKVFKSAMQGKYAPTVDQIANWKLL